SRSAGATAPREATVEGPTGRRSARRSTMSRLPNMSLAHSACARYLAGSAAKRCNRSTTKAATVRSLVLPFMPKIPKPQATSRRRKRRRIACAAIVVVRALVTVGAVTQVELGHERADRRHPGLAEAFQSGTCVGFARAAGRHDEEHGAHLVAQHDRV